MKNKLTIKQEKFINSYIQTGNATKSAIEAGYSPKTARQIAAVTLTKDYVLARKTELETQINSPKIADAIERKERLTEILRARLTDYQETGLDGAGYISITKSSPNTGAIAGIEAATKFDENGNTGTLFTKVKLHNPINAIAELNKMEHIYEPGGNTQNINVVFVIGKGYKKEEDAIQNNKE